VPVDPRYIKPMTACKATVGQCVCVLRGTSHLDLAHSFHDELLGAMGRQILEHYGYIHITSPAVRPYEFLLQKVQVPRRMPPWQVYMADLLAADGIQREGVRRYLTAIHMFGPGSYDAYCRYRVGELLAKQGGYAQAAGEWRRLLREFPRPSPQEYHNRAFDLVGAGPDITEEPEKHWVALARRRLAELPQAKGREVGVTLPAWLPRISLEPPIVTEGDPGKNGKREFALAEDLFLAGDYEFASRDYLKVLTLCYPSRYMPAASFKLGLCQYMRGDPALAGREWRRTVKDFTDSKWAVYAKTALDNLPEARPQSQAPMPAWVPAYDTWPQRGMTYGMALYDHGLPRFAFKEMIKLIHDEYGPSKLKPEARYRAGLAALQFGQPQAAALQWRLCLHDYPDSPWAKRSQASLNELTTAGDLPRSVLATPLPRLSHRNKPACHERLNIAEEFFDAGLADDEETALEYMKALTVTRASPGGYDEAIVPRAESRLAQCLQQMGHADAATRHRLKAAEVARGTDRTSRARHG
jgi:TolA-binding protein